LGLVGQILVQILNAAGVKVIGLDLDQQRCDLAQASGAVACGPPHEPGLSALRAAAARLTGGAGCDHLFITAGGRDSGPVELAVSFARDRARVTDVGKCGLDLAWNEWYDKELELRFSRSYGPGRYDPRYEEGGQDYPIGYVRWTEGRNLQCVLDLIASGRLDPEPLISVVAPFSDAVSTYEKMNNGTLRGLGVLFRYDPEPAPSRRVAAAARPRSARAAGEVVRLGVIGSGNYANSMLLPHLKEHPGVRLVEVATTRGLTAANAQRKFGFARCSTDHRGLLEDREIDAVLIATRHASHARLVCEALAAGKAVFVEKPLAIRPEELAEVDAVVRATGNDRLMVGFNRRFAPLLTRLKESWGPRQGPHVVRYLVNAGPLEHGSWYADATGEGSRFVGEGCHFIDTISWWLGLDPVSVVAAAGPADPSNVSAILLYPDGSRGEIAYLTEGDRAYPKETFEAFGEGAIARLGNFQRFELWRGGKARSERAMLGIDKGQKNEIEAFVRAVATGGPMPIPLPSLLATTAATFAVERAAATRAPALVEIEPAAPDPLASGSPSAAAGR
ncbi:MAG: Gfo/Idh/MocA family oxidoreductase, partial [Rhodospirillaceae bacterium]|nr:Gfo/Idh/MocA family oxidoreductase [Rhodospirillaceae bacterium]